MSKLHLKILMKIDIFDFDEGVFSFYESCHFFLSSLFGLCNASLFYDTCIKYPGM